MARLPPPPLKFLFSHPAHFIACGLGSGLSPFAPGTAGTAFAWLTFPLLQLAYPNDASLALFLLFMFGFGVWCAHLTGKHLGVVDHGAIVWDEIVPFWGVLMFLPPANWFDARVKNGFGVMMDDAIAAAYTVLTLAVIKAAFF
jgi:phosphatidylglycerophosphatase A